MVVTEPEPIVIDEPGVSVWPSTAYCVAEESAVKSPCTELPEPAVDAEATTTGLAVIPPKTIADEDLVAIAVAIGDVDGNVAAGLPETTSVLELLPWTAVDVAPSPEPTKVMEPGAEDCPATITTDPAVFVEPGAADCTATTTAEPEDWTLLTSCDVADPEVDVTAGDAAKATATVVGALLELAPLCCPLDAVEPCDTTAVVGLESTLDISVKIAPAGFAL